MTASKKFHTEPCRARVTVAELTFHQQMAPHKPQRDPRKSAVNT